MTQLQRLLAYERSPLSLAAVAPKTDGWEAFMRELNRFRKPALIVVDMQNDFVREGAPLEVPEARTTIDVHGRLLDFFRKRGFPVIFLRWVSVRDDPYRTLLPRFGWVRFLDEETRACRPHFQRWYADIGREAEAAAVIDELAPRPSEVQIDKRGYGGFLETGLNDHLQEKGVESLFVTGVVTEICVEDTVRQAFQFHYRTTVISDAVASRRPERQAATLEAISSAYGWVSESAEVLRSLQACDP